MQTLHDVGPWLGPLLSGTALLIAAVASWVTYAFYHRRTIQSAWIESYRLLYAEFWKDEKIAMVRHMITDDVTYTATEPILLARLKTDSNQLSEQDNQTLELIDRFCALLIRIRFFENQQVTKKQRELWNETYRNTWIAVIRRRRALASYIYRFWPSLRQVLTESVPGQPPFSPMVFDRPATIEDKSQQT